MEAVGQKFLSLTPLLFIRPSIQVLRAKRAIIRSFALSAKAGQTRPLCAANVFQCGGGGIRTREGLTLTPPRRGKLGLYARPMFFNAVFFERSSNIF
jgi:hypothetical protein